MRYQFPHASHIDTYLKAIEGADEFIVKRDVENGLLIINYVFSCETTFPDPLSFDNPRHAWHAALRRECRGIEFDLESGDLVTRKFHKFFNVNQKPESQSGVIAWHEPHIILDKLDGSLISPFKRKDGVRQWHTKMGDTDVAKPVNRFVFGSDISYNQFCDMLLERHKTPLFEWCSRQQRIVIDYTTESLVLTAIRDNHTGEYMSYEGMVDLAALYNVPVVKALPGNVENIQEFMQTVKDAEGIEGYVIRFADGHAYKVKGEWYLQIHGTKDALGTEKNVWAMILDEKLDDVLPFMSEEDRVAANKFATDFDMAVEHTARRLANQVAMARAIVGEDKKRFATEYMISAGVPQHERGLLFSIYDGKNPVEVVWNYLQKNTGSKTKVESVRGMVGGLSWDRYYKPIELDD